MKRTIFVIVALAMAACLTCGILAGCSNDGGGSDQDGGQSAEFDKIMEKNTIPVLLGENGTLSCMLEEYDESGKSIGACKYEWKTEKGVATLSYVLHSEEDNETEICQFVPSTDGAGASYNMYSSGDLEAYLYAEDGFNSMCEEIWLELLSCPGKKTDEKTDGANKIYTFKESASEDMEYNVESKLTVDAKTEQVKEVEMSAYNASDKKLVYKSVVKDISVGGTLNLPKNPYETIAKCPDGEACNLTVVITDPTQNTTKSYDYRVARKAYVDLSVSSNFRLYSDEAHKNEIEEINVNQASAKVYAVLTEEEVDVDGIEVIE